MAPPDDYLDQLKRAYPARLGHQNWERLRTLIPRLHFTWGEAWERLLLAATNYRTLMERTGKTGSEYVIAAAKFYDDRDRIYAEYADMDMRTPEQIAADRQWTTLEARAAAVGHQVDRSRPPPHEAERVNAAERAAMERTWADRGLNLPKFKVVR